MYPPYVTEEALDRLIQTALAEDVGSGDVTTSATIPEGKMAEARFLAKEDGIVAGLAVVGRVFALLSPDLTPSWTVSDGDNVRAGSTLGTIRGRVRDILTGERLSLNLLQRMSGIATATRLMVDAVRPYHAQILDTRKTAPGLRILDKWAVKLGGGANHRIGLFDMILIKDNHIAASGGIHAAIQAARQYCTSTGRNLEIEVEAGTIAEVQQVIETGGADYILLDNMVRVTRDGAVDTSMLKEAVSLIDGRIKTEASGNVTLSTVNQIAATGVDYISAGVLTHSVKALDISLKIHLRSEQFAVSS